MRPATRKVNYINNLIPNARKYSKGAFFPPFILLVDRVAHPNRKATHYYVTVSTNIYPVDTWAMRLLLESTLRAHLRQHSVEIFIVPYCKTRGTVEMHPFIPEAP